MKSFLSDLLNELSWRGFIHQGTDLEALDALAARETVTGYIGFDCTAPSLHIGHLVSIMMLRVMQRTGHRPIALLGGGTTKVGDPSGKDQTRQLLDDAQIEENKRGIHHSLSKFLSFGEDRAILADNDEWLSGLRYIPFLRDFGRHFTINRMLTFDSVRLRLDREQPLTLLEFNYMVMQAFDFLELSRRYGCRLQLGGSDQWGNIVNGVELGRRIDQTTLFGITTPLITTASGEKMGKSAGNAVWLNENLLGSFDFWQFWRNCEDADVGRFLALFTDLGQDEVRRLAALGGAEVNEAKKTLADLATTLCHGREAAQAARAAAEAQFESGGGALEGLPSIDLAAERLRAGIPLVELFVLAGLAGSNGEARRLVNGRGAKLNDQTISDDRLIVSEELFADGPLKLSAGRKRHVLVRVA